jgi:hypothetical protein
MVTITPTTNGQPIKAKIEINYESAWSYVFKAFSHNALIHDYSGSSDKRDNECAPPSANPFHQVHCLELGARADMDVDSWFIGLLNPHLQKIPYTVTITWHELDAVTNQYKAIPDAVWTKNGTTEDDKNLLPLLDTSRYIL